MKVSALIQYLEEIHELVGNAEVSIFNPDALVMGELEEVEIYLAVGTDRVTGEPRVTIIDEETSLSLIDQSNHE